MNFVLSRSLSEGYCGRHGDRCLLNISILDIADILTRQKNLSRRAACGCSLTDSSRKETLSCNLVRLFSRDDCRLGLCSPYKNEIPALLDGDCRTTGLYSINIKNYGRSS